MTQPSSTSWPAIAELVGEVALLEPAARRDRLSQLAEPLRREVVRYLTAFDSSRLFEQPAAILLTDVDARVAESDAAGPLPEPIGPWRVERLIGRGGMGEVYQAVRDEAGFTQRVALKMVREDVAAGTVLERFRRERELVARLRHRNIAALIDGGVTEQGRPWYAMELVEGEPITTWCDRQRLDPPARIRLFRQVCSAVHAAHRELIVHRDLKPGNILVTADGTVKLLDFGIAKLLRPDPHPAADATLAEWGSGPLTANYASPEQLAGEAVAVPSDIYSLGVVLYQLLTGAVPFPWGGSLAQQRERVATTVARALASAVSGPDERFSWNTARVRRWLRGDIERVVQMALRKDPDRRYPSADALGADLERVATGRPVQARPDGATYRLRRLIGRNKVASMITVGLSLGLVVAAVAAVDRARRAERARSTADLAQARSTRVTTFLADLLGAPDPWRGDREITVRQLLGKASMQAGVEFAADPAAEAAVRLSLGGSFRGQGQWAAARAEFLRARQLTERSSEARLAAERGLAEVIAEEGELASARAWYDSALATAGARRDSLGLAAVMADLAWLYGALGAPDSAARAAELAVALRRRHAAPATDIANALNNDAVSLAERGQADSALARVNEAVALLRGAGSAGEPPLAAALATLAGIRSDRGQYQDADRFYRESLALRRKHFGTGHPDEVGTLVNLGANALELARPGEALAWADTVLARVGPNGVPTGHPLVAAARTVRGRALNGLGRFGEARGELEIALRDRRAHLPAGHPALAYTLVALGEALEGLRSVAQARAAVGEAVGILEHGLGPLHPRTRAARLLLGRL